MQVNICENNKITPGNIKCGHTPLNLIKIIGAFFNVTFPFNFSKKKFLSLQASSMLKFFFENGHLTSAMPSDVASVLSNRGGSRSFRTSVKIFLADGALSALGVVSTGRGRLQAGGGVGG
jgi:hypothetical protein